ncbi:hypothetical protein A3770_18p80990 [Chloropicon primus]|uniref:Uncharacterized protein n=1 Tax=Chloropicon primus TaxID=1764295 RepID=A0A5B8MYZ0_9CHLO|nr:hypothetical protein A3770_18p80990 [Chloropicon primus]|eukprot:QDZ25581.1 hypothetical protein A3770_18p80990 [Chloropicon primus]
MSKYSFWLLKPHQKPVSCQFEITEGTGVRLLRDSGGQLFKFTFEKIVKWNLGRDPNFLELQIQIGKTGPAGSLKFQVKDGTSTDDIHNILEIITRCKGGASDGQGSKPKASSVHEKTNVERKKEAEDIQRASKEKLKKIKEERKQQSMVLQQANVTVAPPKKDAEAIKDRMAHHKKSIQMKVERKRSFAVTTKEPQKEEQPKKDPPPPPPPKTTEKARRKASSRASIYSLASSSNYEEEEEEGSPAKDAAPQAPPPKPAAQALKPKVMKKARQPSGIMPASRVVSKAKPPPPSLSAIGEDEGEEDKGAAKRKSVPPPPPTSPSPRKLSSIAASSATKPPPPPKPSPQAEQKKKMSLVQARRSMFQQMDGDSNVRSSIRSRSPSPKPGVRKEEAEGAATPPTPAAPSAAPASPPPSQKKKTPPPPAPAAADPSASSEQVARSPPKAESNAGNSAAAQDTVPVAEKRPKRGSFMLNKIDASSQPDLAEAKSTINMLKMELQKQMEKSQSIEKKLVDANTELGTVTSKYDSAVRERDAYLEEITSLKKAKLSLEEQQKAGDSGAGPDSEENSNLREENSNLLQSEALLLRSVVDASERLGALRNRLWQVCEVGEEAPEGEESEADDADADLQELRRTITSLAKAVETMESEKLEREEEKQHLEKKLKREQGHKKKMEQQIKEEGEVTSALMTEAEAAAIEGEDMRSMMEEFKRIAEERSNDLESMQMQKDQAYSELARVTRDYDLLRANVEESVEKAIAEERTKSVAHLKSELSKEKQKYEGMLEDLLRDEEERSKMEEDQAEEIEKQVAQALKENEKVLQERLNELEAEFASKMQSQEQAGKAEQDGALDEAKAELEASNAKVGSLEKELQKAKDRKAKDKENLVRMKSEIRVLSARTSSAYRAVESFVDQSTTFADSSISALLQKSEDFLQSVEREASEVLTALEEEIEEVSNELNSHFPMPSTIDMSPSSTEMSPMSKTGPEEDEGEDEGDVTEVTSTQKSPAAESSPKARKSKVKRKSTARKSFMSPTKSSEGKMVHVDLSQLPKSLVGNLADAAGEKSEKPATSARKSSVAASTTPSGRRESVVKKADLELLSKEISDKVRKEFREAMKDDEATRVELAQLKEAYEALQEELRASKEGLESSKKKEAEADLICAAVESQCRTLALELAAQKLVNTSNAVTGEEDVLVKDSSRSASSLDMGSNRLVVPVDIVKDTLPHYTLLELGDVGMKLGASEVALARKQTWDFPWDRVNQITVGIANEYVSLDLFEHANAEAAHLRVRDVRHLNTVLTVITKKRIEAALASTTYATGARAATSGSPDGLDFGLNVTRVYQDPGEAAENKAMGMQLKSTGPGGSVTAGGRPGQPPASTTMSPAVVRISSVSRGLARTHANLKRRLLSEGLSSQKPSVGDQQDVNLGGAGPDQVDMLEFSDVCSEGGDLTDASLRKIEEETERERSLCSKVASLEAVRNDLVHKLATLRVNAVNAVMQSHNVVKYLASASREDMASDLKKIESDGALDEEVRDLQKDEDESGKFRVPSWKPVNESVKSLLSESLSWSASDFATSKGRAGGTDFSFGMNDAEKEAFLVAQAEAELTQSAVNCLESLWSDRVKKVQGQLALVSQKGEETQEHESTLLQDLASARAQVATLQEELTFSNRELSTLKHVYESQELEERERLKVGDQDEPEVISGDGLADSQSQEMAIVLTGGSSPTKQQQQQSGVPAPARGKLPDHIVSSVQVIKPYTYLAPKKETKEKGGEPSPLEEVVDAKQTEDMVNEENESRQRLIVANYDDIQMRQKQLALEVSEAVENLKYIDEKLSDLDNAASVVGEKVESYFENLTSMEESYDRNKQKLGQIEQEIYEQDRKIAEVKSSVGTVTSQQESLAQQLRQQTAPHSVPKKVVTFASPPSAETGVSPLSERKENNGVSSVPPLASMMDLGMMYGQSVPSTPTAQVSSPVTPPSSRVSLSVKAKKLENVVQNIMDLIG